MKLAQQESYLALINNSLGSEIFKNRYFVSENEEVFDLLEGGNLSCSFFVSSVLYLTKLSDIHLTVESTLNELKDTAKFDVVNDNYKPGDVLLWSETIESNGHKHLGFYIGEDQAISNSPSEKRIIKHHYTYEGKRPIIEAFRPKFS